MAKKHMVVKFRIFLSTIILALLTLAVGSIMVVTYFLSRNSTAGLCRQLMERTSEEAANSAFGYLKPVEDLLKVTRSQVEHRRLDVDNWEELGDQLIHIIQVYPQINMFMWTRPNGDIIFSKSMEDNGRTYSVKMIRRGDGVARTVWRHQNPGNSGVFPDLVEPEAKAFDPRQRPWWPKAVAARDLIWTDIYIFFSDRQPGIAAATPCYSSDGSLMGVLTAAVSLDRLSTYIKNLRVAKTGQAFIVDQDGRMVGMRDLDELKVERLDAMGQKTYEPRNVVDLRRSSEIRAAVLAPQAKEDGDGKRSPFFQFAVGRDDYFAYFVHTPPGYGWRWRVGVIVPEDDFMAQVRINTAISLIISLLCFLSFGVAATFLSKRVSTPLHLLALDAERIKRFDLSVDSSFPSIIYEIEEMWTAFANMKKGLRSFQKFVPSDLVNLLLESGQVAEVGGEERNLTVFFSDIAGFTSISEKMDPQALTELLSEYLQEMSESVAQHHGTVDKFIGDSVMAFWGAPRRLEDHAVLTCLAALDNRARLARLVEKWKLRSSAHFDIRIGIHTGRLVVGNIGAHNRLNYTVIGDTVNTASRLESLNKAYGTKIIIGEATWAAAKEKIEARLLDLVAVKGKTRGINVYELLGAKGQLGWASCPFLSVWEEAADRYFAKEFKKALELFQRALEMEPRDPVCSIFIGRCRDYMANPPPENWDGVYVMKTK
ncbi:MAG: hypothetical protein HY897_11075 [Deltaproteobacteria bacterium]|nr:hypothetical protein [Deltaproteobacteria bacterium]